MENQEKFSEIAYKKAKKRVKDISNYYWFIACYVIVAFILLYGDYGEKLFNFSREYVVFMLALQGIPLLGYGIYLFVPFFRNWEERKIQKIMNKNKH